MNSKSVYRKKRVGSCLALCLIGAVMSSTMSIPAWAAPASGTAKDDNTVVRDAIKGTPVGSLNANQEVKVKSEQKSEDGYTWYQISFDWNGAQTEGWVRGDLITDGASAAGSTQTRQWKLQVLLLPIIRGRPMHRKQMNSVSMIRNTKLQKNFRKLRCRRDFRQQRLHLVRKRFLLHR